MNQRLDYSYFTRSLLLAFLFAFLACHSKVEESTAATGPKAPPITVHQAAFMGDAKAIEQHIKAGTDLNKKDEYGSTPLNIAATFDKLAIAKLLIDAGADLSVRSNDGSTALHTAAFFGRKEIVKALLEADVDIEAKNNYGSTALASIVAPFEQVKPIYDQISKDLGPLGFKLNYEELKATLPEIVALLSNKQ